MIILLLIHPSLPMFFRKHLVTKIFHTNPFEKQYTNEYQES